MPDDKRHKTVKLRWGAFEGGPGVTWQQCSGGKRETSACWLIFMIHHKKEISAVNRGTQ
jgi:hypothetical protein